jgi:diadenosine tetraphosphatase ApaH/serine/threonine PP2A family protein phosphatase
MILAIISDIHGNAPALDAVLGDLPSVDVLVCCGDAVGYYADAAEVVDRLRALRVAMVRGNHELMVCGLKPVLPERAAAYRTEWTRQALSAEQLRWLRALPATLDVNRDGLSIRVRHASPWDEDTRLLPDSPALGRVDLAPDQWLVVGHTHYPMLVPRGAGWLANAGSVGQPRDWNPGAAYALLDTQTGEWEQRRVAYDHGAYQRRLEALGWESATVALLGRVAGFGVRNSGLGTSGTGPSPESRTPSPAL